VQPAGRFASIGPRIHQQNQSTKKPNNKAAVIKDKPVKPNKTNIMRGALSGIVAFTILASAAPIHRYQP